ITFGRYTPSYDGAYFLDRKVKKREEGEIFLHELDSLYPMLPTEERDYEEWPSETWNFQDNYGKSVKQPEVQQSPELFDKEGSDETEESETSVPVIEKEEIKKLLMSVKGIGRKKAEKILERYDTPELVELFENAPKLLKKEFVWFKKKMLKELDEVWKLFKEKL
ncbi:MAG: hypothetical protein WC163_11750, partial [Sulfurovum sp.]